MLTLVTCPLQILPHMVSLNCPAVSSFVSRTLFHGHPMRAYVLAYKGEGKNKGFEAYTNPRVAMQESDQKRKP